MSNTTREDSIAAVMRAATSGDNCAEPTVFCAHWHAALKAAIEQALKDERIRTLEAVEDRHACCTIGCGAVAVDGDDKGFCPTCLLAQRMLAEARCEKGVESQA